MITARFMREGGRYSAFTIRGHAGYADKGEDIVCAAVTSSVQLALNTITDVMCAPADVQVKENTIALSLQETRCEGAQQVLEGLRQHLCDMAERYPAHVRVDA